VRGISLRVDGRAKQREQEAGYHEQHREGDR
jgi:hypothetical protein